MKTITKSHESAFPGRPDDNVADIGLTKREYFAAMAMQALASDPTLTSHKTPLEVAHIATVYADALIEELNK